MAGKNWPGQKRPTVANAKWRKESGRLTCRDRVVSVQQPTTVDSAEAVPDMRVWHA